jgi:hypothetical protein
MPSRGSRYGIDQSGGYKPVDDHKLYNDYEHVLDIYVVLPGIAYIS